MNYQLLIAEEAYLDIQDAYDFYADLPIEGIEDRFLNQLKSELQYISKSPESLAVKYKGIRISNLERFPYQIHYLIVNSVVRVFGVFHDKSNPKTWAKRLET